MQSPQEPQWQSHVVSQPSMLLDSQRQMLLPSQAPAPSFNPISNEWELIPTQSSFAPAPAASTSSFPTSNDWQSFSPSQSFSAPVSSAPPSYFPPPNEWGSFPPSQSSSAPTTSSNLPVPDWAALYLPNDTNPIDYDDTINGDPDLYSQGLQNVPYDRPPIYPTFFDASTISLAPEASTMVHTLPAAPSSYPPTMSTSQAVSQSSYLQNASSLAPEAPTEAPALTVAANFVSTFTLEL